MSNSDEMLIAEIREKLPLSGDSLISRLRARLGFPGYTTPSKNEERYLWLKHFLYISPRNEPNGEPSGRKWTCWLSLEQIPFRFPPWEENVEGLIDALMERFPLPVPLPPHALPLDYVKLYGSALDDSMRKSKQINELMEERDEIMKHARAPLTGQSAPLEERLKAIARVLEKPVPQITCYRCDNCGYHIPLEKIDAARASRYAYMK